MPLHPPAGELDAIIAAASQTIAAPARPVFNSFITALYHDVASSDIMLESASQHALRATGFWQWGQQRANAKAPQVRLYNPPASGGHWRDDATYVEVITADMPFLVDSVSAALARAGAEVKLLLHPVFTVTRSANGTLEKLIPEKQDGVARESWMHISIRRQPENALPALKTAIEKVLADVALAVADWQPMRRVMEGVIGSLPKNDPEEIRAFLEWIHGDHFVFLGHRDYRLSADGTKLEVQHDTALGLLHDPDFVVFKGIRVFSELPKAVQTYLQDPNPLVVNKARSRSTVHRDAPFDIIGIKSFDKSGKFIGLKVFIGLFTSVAYARTAEDVPWLRRKVARVVARSGLDPKSHSGKALVHILNTYPRDELFLMDDDSLYANARGVLLLAERQRTASFIWLEPFGRFWSCLIYSPRDRFDSTLRHRFISVLEQALGAKSSGFNTWIGDSPLVRLQVTLETPEGEAPKKPDIIALERRIIDIARGWDEKLEDALVASHGAEQGLALYDRFKGAFPAIYRDSVSPALAVSDLPLAAEVLSGQNLSVALHAVPGQPERVDLRFYHAGSPLVLSNILPRLENLGLRVLSEVPYSLTPKEGTVWVQAIATESRDGKAINLSSVEKPFIDAIRQLESGLVEDDGFNRLILQTGLSAREVSVLRAYGHYLQQAGFTPTPAFIRKTLAAHSGVAIKLVQYFHAAFDPAYKSDRTTETTRLQAEIETALDAVTNLAEDQVLRRYLNLVTSTLRTNYYQNKPYISFKLDSQQVLDLPLPRPLVEIWVYSPRMEGVHLRGGRVARGGIRWSDRRDDFRTEVLGLMKAQMVKNTVIVPVGSKGGFVCKQLPSDKAAEAKEVIACYQTLIRGLLDITDNRIGMDIITPDNVVRRDGDDPYLVVAADKGTAKFSDIANALSLDYGFWLGDAFASGGSVGYDHKHMGITARGAWEAVKRHFRELGRDIQATPFTCVGVGDMAGDVFGNGMLRSPHTLLVAAFNHKHIFLDPAPDAAKGFAERQRLFDLPGSQWSDYNPALISTGGGVFERAAKSISLSPEVQQLLGLKVDKLAPSDLIQAILKAEVDLIYLGGIGTYVKASTETHAEVSDRANDTLRINASDIRARVVGEGANLGVTARARIEYAAKGGRINSDAVDNSAGVDTSDHEVNIKIALQPEVAKGNLTFEARNKLLAEMTDDVAKLVLRDNYLQPQIISLEQQQAPRLLNAHQRLMQTLERAGRLDRAVEYLPTDEQLAARAEAGQGLTRPEIAILVAYSKMALYDELLKSTVPDDAALESELLAYFPSAMQQQMPAALKAHRLRREIIATILTNDIINRMGSTFVLMLAERSGYAPADVVRAYLVVRSVYQLPELFAAIEALDNKVTGTVQLSMLASIMHLIERATSAALQISAHPLDIAKLSRSLGPSLAHLAAQFATLLPAPLQEGMAKEVAALTGLGTPEALAVRLARLSPLAAGPDILVVASEANTTPEKAAAVYYAVGQRFGFDSLRAQAASHKGGSHWQRQAVQGVIDELYGDQQRLAVSILKDSAGDVAKWEAAHGANNTRVTEMLAELKSAPGFDLAMLTVAARTLKNLADT